MENEMTNPAVIMLINMTIVFAVLALLNLFIRLIHFIEPRKRRLQQLHQRQHQGRRLLQRQQRQLRWWQQV